ncbi:MAG: hypothetical protein ACI9UJ_001337, partial [bacterium]
TKNDERRFLQMFIFLKASDWRRYSEENCEELNAR